MSALEFLSSDNVTVKTWYSKKTPGRETIAHAKAWIVKKPDGCVALVGSANLTEQGFRYNFEMMALVADVEVPTLVAEMEETLGNAKESKKRIASYLEEFELNRIWNKLGNTQKSQSGKTVVARVRILYRKFRRGG